MKGKIRNASWAACYVIVAVFFAWGFIFCPYETAHDLMPHANGTNIILALNYLPIIVFTATLGIAFIIIACLDMLPRNFSNQAKIAVFMITIIIGSCIDAILNLPSSNIASSSNIRVIYDGSCSASAKNDLPSLTPPLRVALQCGEGDQTRTFFMGLSDFTGSDYIIRHPGTLVHCKVFANADAAKCDTSTTKPSDP